MVHWYPLPGLNTVFILPHDKIAVRAESKSPKLHLFGGIDFLHLRTATWAQQRSRQCHSFWRESERLRRYAPPVNHKGGESRSGNIWVQTLAAQSETTFVARQWDSSGAPIAEGADGAVSGRAAQHPDKFPRIRGL